jgi:uncharacterized coiled-coil DUF342 family protein
MRKHLDEITKLASNGNETAKEIVELMKKADTIRQAKDELEKLYLETEKEIERFSGELQELALISQDSDSK